MATLLKIVSSAALLVVRGRQFTSMMLVAMCHVRMTSATLSLWQRPDPRELVEEAVPL
jgi:hypothetical protein